MKKVLVTGAAGFIGYYLVKVLIDNDYEVIGIDNLNDYYDITLKENRINELINKPHFTFIKADINDYDGMKAIFLKYYPEIVVHLAAYAGVRHSIENPDIYFKNNIDGFYNILTLSNEFKISHLIFASSSSVYGNINGNPSKEEDASINQESIYASTKMCNEVMAYGYAKMFDMPITAIRPFAVYGPLGRPDMAYFTFTNKLLNNEKIVLYNNGNFKRDYTYITDLIDVFYKIISNKPKNLYNVYNIGSSKQYKTTELVNIIKEELISNNLVPKDFDFDSLIIYSDTKKGEVNETYADISKMSNDFGYQPKTSLESGIKEFINWYRDYYLK